MWIHTAERRHPLLSEPHNARAHGTKDMLQQQQPAGGYGDHFQPSYSPSLRQAIFPCPIFPPQSCGHAQLCCPFWFKWMGWFKQRTSSPHSWLLTSSSSITVRFDPLSRLQGFWVCTPSTAYKTRWLLWSTCLDEELSGWTQLSLGCSKHSKDIQNSSLAHHLCPCLPELAWASK